MVGAMLDGRTIHLCVTGGIAAYKAAELTRLLVKRGAMVQVAMSKNATDFIGAMTFQALTQRPVFTQTLDPTEELEIGHIAFAQNPDLIVVVPATANVIAKAAQGIADDVVTTVLAATNKPVLVAPAMNTVMYEQDTVVQNLATLRARGWHIVGPGAGTLACGAVGPGRLAEHEAIINGIEHLLRLQMPLLGRKVMVTAGATREYIDPVRFLSNPSSGRMGLAVAAAAHAAGADVTLIHGSMAVSPGAHLNPTRVISAADMHAAVLNVAKDCDAVFMAAAVSDWRPVEQAAQKQKKIAQSMSLELVRTNDILAELGRHRSQPGPLLVGWAAETHDVVESAKAKLVRKNLDLIVANDITQSGAGFETDTNQVTLVDADGVHPLEMMSKTEIGVRLMHWLVAALGGRR